MALLLASLLATHRVSCWWEFVDSHANPSDPLSRGGYDDPTVRSKLAKGLWKRARVDEVRWEDLVLLQERLLGKYVSALGCSEAA